MCGWEVLSAAVDLRPKAASVVMRKQMAVADAGVGETLRAGRFILPPGREQGNILGTYFCKLSGDQILFPLLRMGWDSALQECGKGI